MSASSDCCLQGFIRVSLLLFLMLLLLLLSLTSVDTAGLVSFSKWSGGGGMQMQMQMQMQMERRRKDLGSRPPLCVNKCLSCRPCMATLVVSPRGQNKLLKPYRHEDDDAYYLLSWKCACGDRFFQP